MKSILHKSFRYVPAARTNVAATFRRIRADIKAKLEREAADAAEASAKVKPLIRGKAV